MTRTFTRALASSMGLVLLLLGVGCASPGTNKPSDTYYQRGSIHYDSFPQTAGRGGYRGYGRYGRY